MGGIQKWLVFVREHPNLKWMMTGGSPVTQETIHMFPNPILTRTWWLIPPKSLELHIVVDISGLSLLFLKNKGYIAYIYFTDCLFKTNVILPALGIAYPTVSFDGFTFFLRDH